MTDEGVRTWLVERTFDDRNLVTLVYATPDGREYVRQERSARSLERGDGATAAIEVSPGDLAAVSDQATRERYRSEAERTRERYDPDEAI